jgi:hypothetical protein
MHDLRDLQIATERFAECLEGTDVGSPPGDRISSLNSPWLFSSSRH